VPRPGQKRGGPGKPRGEGGGTAGVKRPPRKEAGPAPKTTVKRPKKVVKEEAPKPEAAKPEGGEQKE